MVSAAFASQRIAMSAADWNELYEAALAGDSALVRFPIGAFSARLKPRFLRSAYVHDQLYAFRRIAPIRVAFPNGPDKAALFVQPQGIAADAGCLCQIADPHILIGFIIAELGFGIAQRIPVTHSSASYPGSELELAKPRGG
jgi:hypothetical protein